MAPPCPCLAAQSSIIHTEWLSFPNFYPSFPISVALFPFSRKDLFQSYFEGDMRLLFWGSFWGRGDSIEISIKLLPGEGDKGYPNFLPLAPCLQLLQRRKHER